jgi:predicted lipoprotein
MIETKRRGIAVLYFFTAVLLVFTSCTVKKISEVDAGKDSGEYSTWTKSGSQFEPLAWVEENWESRFIPAFREECVEFDIILEALKADRDKAIADYGLPKNKDAVSFVFKVKGEALVLEYDKSSRNGLIKLDLGPKDGIADASIQVGPVIKNTALRDSVDFIKFTEVGNQLQFASLADELNNKMKKSVIEPLDLENITGKNIDFYGAFKLEQSDSIDGIVITVVILDQKE